MECKQLLTMLLAGFILAVMIQYCTAEERYDDHSITNDTSQSVVDTDHKSSVTPVLQSEDQSPVKLETATNNYDPDSDSRGHGIKIKKKKPKLKKNKKFLKKFLPFLLIPLLIQAKLIPLFLFKLKLVALKAFGIGKLALILIAINVIYNFMHGAQDIDQQYNKEILASEHYGYNGGPEYGAWVNRRVFNLQKY